MTQKHLSPYVRDHQRTSGSFREDMSQQLALSSREDVAHGPGPRMVFSTSWQMRLQPGGFMDVWANLAPNDWLD